MLKEQEVKLLLVPTVPGLGIPRVQGITYKQSISNLQSIP